MDAQSGRCLPYSTDSIYHSPSPCIIRLPSFATPPVNHPTGHQKNPQPLQNPPTSRTRFRPKNEAIRRLIAVFDFIFREFFDCVSVGTTSDHCVTSDPAQMMPFLPCQDLPLSCGISPCVFILQPHD